MSKNQCCTYFAVKGEFNPDEISKQLDLTPCKQWRSGDRRKNGSEHTFALWEYGRCDEYDVMTDNMMMKTIGDLMPKVHILQQIHKMFEVSFFLEVVPTVYPGEVTPCLSPSRDVIRFCFDTGTRLDIDLYVHDGNDEETISTQRCAPTG